jgi:hypothetical protein
MQTNVGLYVNCNYIYDAFTVHYVTVSALSIFTVNLNERLLYEKIQNILNVHNKKQRKFT